MAKRMAVRRGGGPVTSCGVKTGGAVMCNDINILCGSNVYGGAWPISIYINVYFDVLI